MNHLEKLCKLIRYYILISTTEAQSGHPTSSLSAVELMTTLMFGDFFRYDVDHPENPNNDRLIFSKGHASPLFYSLWAAAGKVSESELLTLRKFGSRLEGHPAMRFPYTEVSTGSLGQGLSVGIGMALNAKYLDKLPYKTYVLLGDSEMAEGSNWEAIQIASYYKLNNLIGIVDVNRLGQRGETMLGHNVDAYQKRISAFGWNTIVIDGHDSNQIEDAYKNAQGSEMPTMIVAKTIKGKGVSLWEDKNGFHSKQLNQDQLQEVITELGPVEKDVIGIIQKPEEIQNSELKIKNDNSEFKVEYEKGQLVATKKAFGLALVKLFPQNPSMIVLDAELSNSTQTDMFQKAYPDRFFEMFIAEQNMIGVAAGLSARGKHPVASTFASFLSRAHDQIRMNQYSQSNILYAGSYSGTSLGKDGPSQMGLEDISLFRSINESVIFYPSDAISTEKIISVALQTKGTVYLRLTREPTPILYETGFTAKVGGSFTTKQSDSDVITIIGAGITLHEALKAYELLQKEGIAVRVIDLYCVKPLDEETLTKAANETKAIVTVEDHYEGGGIGEAIKSLLCNQSTPIYSLCVRKMPQSGEPQELLDYEEISAAAIVKKVKEVLQS